MNYLVTLDGVLDERLFDCWYGNRFRLPLPSQFFCQAAKCTSPPVQSHHGNACHPPFFCAGGGYSGVLEQLLVLEHW